MIINLPGQRDDSRKGAIKFKLPKIYFDRKFMYKVGVHFVYLEKGQEDESTKDELFCLNTNLVDGSSVNPMQTIFHFHHLRKMNHFRRVAPSVVYYSLHLFDFEHATFEVTRPFSPERLDIEKIFIQLEIVKIDPYGRIQ